MKPRSLFSGSPLVLSALFALSANADVIDTSSQEPWERCAYCHGIDGISGNARFPNLAGQRQDYLAKQLRDFREGKRSNDDSIMTTQAENLEDAEIRVLAKYFSQQSPAVADAKSSTDDGQRIYQKGATDQDVPACIACHGHGGHGIPKLTGQHEEYLAKQLNDFANEKRTNAPDGTMVAIARNLTEQQRQQVAAYIASLGGGSH